MKQTIDLLKSEIARLRDAIIEANKAIEEYEQAIAQILNPPPIRTKRSYTPLRKLALQEINELTEPVSGETIYLRLDPALKVNKPRFMICLKRMVKAGTIIQPLEGLYYKKGAK